MTGQEVWVYNPKYGFRIIDRNWPVNKAAIHNRGRVWVVDPTDWTVAAAEAPEILKKYGFKTIGIVKTDHPEQELVWLKAKYREKKSNLRAEAKKQAHLLHLKQFGFAAPEPATVIHVGPRRSTHCWRCKSPLDSDDDIACAVCRWLLCDCGACGCGYLGGESW